MQHRQFGYSWILYIMLMATVQKPQNHTKVILLSIASHWHSPFYDFCGFWSVAVKSAVVFSFLGDRFGSPYDIGPLSVLFVTLVHCGQTVGWIKMLLGMEVGLGPGHIVLDRDPAPPPRKGHSSPHFSAHVYYGQMIAQLSNCWALVSMK